MNSAALPLSTAMLAFTVLPNNWKSSKAIKHLSFMCTFCYPNVMLNQHTCLLFSDRAQLWEDSLSRNSTNATPLLIRVCLSLTTVTLQKNYTVTMIKLYYTSITESIHCSPKIKDILTSLPCQILSITVGKLHEIYKLSMTI